MQKQKSISVAALLITLAVLIAFGGVATSSAAQATKAPTAAPTLAVAKLDYPGIGLVTKGDDKEAKALTASGATFPAKLYAAWFAQYKKITGVEVNYGGGGSGKGITDIQGQTVDFAGTDGAMTDEQIKAAKGGDIVHIPTALGAVVLTYNIPEAKEPVKLTADTIAGIYLLKITKWNDAAIVKDNPALKNVNKDILVVRRDDGSGTTNIFTSYLAAVNADWAKTYKSGNTVNWPEGTVGGKGNDGVAGVVTQTPYSIGYVELIFALSNKLGYATVQNKAGKWIVPNLKSVTEAAAGFLKQTPDDLRVKIVNADGDGAYSISGYTWQLVYTKQTDAAKALAITRLLWWETHDGQQYNEGLGFAPLPKEIVAKSEAQILKIQIDGKQALPTTIATAKK